MKKNILILVFFSIIAIALTSNVLAANSCSLQATLVNQDPYPAVPGDYVKLVFQITGVENPDCGLVNVELLQDFPISFDPNATRIVSVQSGTHLVDFPGFLLAPFKVRVDPNAVDGDNSIRLKYSTNADVGASATYTIKDFNLNVKNAKSDFDVIVQDVTPQGTSFIITNTGNNDASSIILTVQSEDVSVSGPKSVVIGSLAKGDFTIAHVRVIPNQGVGNLSIGVSYTDSSGNRINSEKVVPVESSNRIEKICWSSSEAWYVKWIFAIVGIFVGIEVTILLRTLSNKKKS